MTRLEKVLFTLVIVSSLVTIVLWWKPVSESREAESLNLSKIKDLSAELAEVRAENARLSASVLEAQSRSKLDVAERSKEKFTSQFTLLADLQRRGLMRRGLSVFEVEGGITPQWAEAFGLVESEIATLNQAVEAARRKIGQLELANATVRMDGDKKAIITVKTFSEGGPIYDELVQTFAQVMGRDRYAAFAELGLKDLEDGLHQLGVGVRTLTVTHNPASPDPRKRYHVAEKVVRPDGTQNLEVAGGARMDGLIGIYLGPLRSLLPPDF
jgi:hypothetical protein